MKINFKKLIGLAIVVAGSYKIGESIGKLKGSVDSMKFVLKNHPELDGLTVKAGDSWVTVNFEGKNDEEKQMKRSFSIEISSNRSPNLLMRDDSRYESCDSRYESFD